MTHPSPTPSLLISTRATPLLRLSAYEASAHEAAFTGVDLDGTDELRRTLVVGRRLDRAITGAMVRSIWLRPVQVDDDHLSGLVSGAGQPPLIVVSAPEAIARTDTLPRQLEAARTLRRQVGGPLDVAIAVRADNPDGSHRHLERLTALRHMCAEWDLGVALDLFTVPDPAWEAEAATVRLLSRLAIVRIAVPRTILSGGQRWRMASRVVATLTDAGYSGYLSLVPELSIIEKHSTAAVIDRCASFAVNVERRAIRHHHDRSRRLGRRRIGQE